MTGETRVRRDAGALILGGVILAAALYASCQPWNLRDRFFIGAPMGRDFANFWLGPRLVLDGQAALLANWDDYNALIQRVFDRAPDFVVYSYPPTALLLLAPLALLPFVPAVTLYTALNLAALATASRSLGAAHGLVAAVVFSPAALVAAIWGHFGGLLALAVTLGLREAQRRPALGGAFLALLAVKPQFGAAVGGILLLAGFWRCALWSAAFAGLYAAASALAFGLGPWRDFVEVTMPAHARLFSDFKFSAMRTTITLYTSARLAGLGPSAALAMQAALGLAAVTAAIAALRRHGPTPAAVAAALLAAMLALPYANHYDLAVAAPALGLALIGGPERPRLKAWLLWLMPALTLPFGLVGSPLTGVGYALGLVLLLRGLLADRAMRAGPPPTIGAVPA